MADSTSKRKLTIWEALCEKLGRDPTNEECKTEIFRILRDVPTKKVTKGKLPFQRKH